MKIPLHIKSSHENRERLHEVVDLEAEARGMRKGNDGFRAARSGKHHKGRRPNPTRFERLTRRLYDN